MTRGRGLDVALLALVALVVVVFVLLGNWQVQRLAWKLDLIDQVETRAYSEPVPATVDSVLPYTRVTAEGVFLHQHSLRIKAVTELGPGFWIMTPLKTDAEIIWINRGFIPTGLAPEEIVVEENPQQIIGLARASVPDGTWLEKNDPANGRWYSADVPAMSEWAGLTAVAPYYIDVEQSGAAGSWPRGGLTQLKFRNTHLIYALTWYAMALLLTGAVVYVVRERRKL